MGLLDADVRQRDLEYASFEKTCTLVICLYMPIAVGSMFTPVAVMWLIVGFVVGVALNSGFACIVTLSSTYLLASFLIWLNIRRYEKQEAELDSIFEAYESSSEHH